MLALVSQEDYEQLARYNWQAHISRGAFYATRGEFIPETGRQRTIRMHRVILNAPDDMEVDHINGDGLDNRRENLRLASRGQNMGNVPVSRNNRSGYLGVHLESRTGRWAAACRGRNLGSYDTPEEAARAYDTEARRVHGPFARPNFPDDMTAVAPRTGGPARNNTSGYRGVSFRKDEGKWTARFFHEGQRFHLGYFPTAEAAAAAIEVKRQSLHP